MPYNHRYHYEIRDTPPIGRAHGTDVYHLYEEIEKLERRLRHREEALLRKQRDYADLERRHHRLEANYERLMSAYDRAMALLRERRRSGR